MTVELRSLVALALLGLTFRGFAADTLVVDLNGTGQYTDIQSAIDAAADGDTVLVKPGEYVVTEPVTFKGKQITVKSEGGAEVTAILGGGVAFGNAETNATVLEGFTVSGVITAACPAWRTLPRP